MGAPEQVQVAGPLVQGGWAWDGGQAGEGWCGASCGAGPQGLRGSVSSVLGKISCSESALSDINTARQLFHPCSFK